MSEYIQDAVNYLTELAKIENESGNYASAFMLSDAACIIIDQNKNIERLLGVIKAKNE